MTQLAQVHRVNIAEVAAAAQVGVGTVSRVLNNNPSVREGTRRRVLDAIQRLNYRPSRLAASLSRGSQRTVVILVPYITRPSVVARLSGAISVLDDQGFDVVLRNVETAAERDRHLHGLTAHRWADGALIISIPLSGDHLAALRQAHLAVAMVDTAAPGVPATVTDDIHGGALATEHLIGLGHRQIGFVGDHASSELGFASTRRRLLGYRRALERHGHPVDPRLVRLGEHSGAAAAALGRELLSLPEPPTAIFASSDTQALGVLKAAEEAGRSVPGQLSVVGYDDIDTAAQIGLSTVHQPLAESGARGASRLCELIGGQQPRPLRDELPVALITRATSGRLRLRPRPPPDSDSISPLAIA